MSKTHFAFNIEVINPNIGKGYLFWAKWNENHIVLL